MEAERNEKTILKLMKELWPQTFLDENPQPIKVGIFQDILDSGLPKDRPFTARDVQKGIRFYTGWPQYQKGLLTECRPRIDLGGQTVGEVSPEQVQMAIARIKAARKAYYIKVRAKAEAAAAALAVQEAKERRKVAEKLKRQTLAAERYRLANETEEEKVARKKAKAERKRQRQQQNRLNRLNRLNQPDQAQAPEPEPEPEQQKQINVEYRRRRTFDPPKSG